MKKQTRDEVNDLHTKIRQALGPTLVALVRVLTGVYLKDPAAAREIRRLVLKDINDYFDETFTAIEGELKRQEEADKKTARAERGDVVLWLVGAGTVLLAVLAVGAWVFVDNHTQHPICTVTEKDRTKNSDGSSDARIYTDDCGVLEVSDSLLAWHWSSGDTYAAIKPGNTYKFETRGYRVPFLSLFPNIVEVTEVRADASP